MCEGCSRSEPPNLLKLDKCRLRYTTNRLNSDSPGWREYAYLLRGHLLSVDIRAVCAGSGRSMVQLKWRADPIYRARLRRAGSVDSWLHPERRDQLDRHRRFS